MLDLLLWETKKLPMKQERNKSFTTVFAFYYIYTLFYGNHPETHEVKWLLGREECQWKN